MNPQFGRLVLSGILILLVAPQYVTRPTESLKILQLLSYSGSPPIFFWNPKVHCHVRKSPPLVSILSHMNPMHTMLYFSKINFNIILSFTRKSSKRSLQVFLPELCIHFSYGRCLLHVPPISSFFI
jgi:hypothetical protein